MLDDYGFEKFEENAFPIAYLITFRTFGTWLHGDARTSVDRIAHNQFGVRIRTQNVPLEESMRAEMKQPEVCLDELQRSVVKDAIIEVCQFRNYFLQAINVRTNHAHCVVGAQMKPDRIADAFKAYSTKKPRAENLIDQGRRVWSRGKSCRYLWKPGHVEAAINYVLYCQGDIPFVLDDVDTEDG
ncbi:MAG: transposase [Pyrinomonadaceae bacterium]